MLNYTVEPGSVLYIIGQGFGIIAIILGFVSYQCKTQKMLLLLQTFAALVFIIHYLLIGATSGMAMNIISLAKNFTYFLRAGKSNKKIIPIIFTILMGIMGILSWTNWYSIFVFLGLIINTYCTSFSDPRNIKKSILVTSPLVLIYDIFTLSIGGIIFESVSAVSALIGLLRTRPGKEAAVSK